MPLHFHPVGPKSYPIHVYHFCCDQKNQMKLSYLLRWMQEYARDHADEMGLGWQALMEEDMVYLLSRMTVKILRMPKTGEDILLKTWERGATGPLYNREFSISSGDGERLVEATTQWMLVSPTTRRIIRPTKAGFDTPKQTYAAAVEDRGKLHLPDALLPVGERVIRYADIDCNGHVNNAVYADILCDFCGLDLGRQQITELTLSFVHEATIGDVIYLYTARQGNETWMEGKVGEQICFQARLETGEDIKEQ